MSRKRIAGLVTGDHGLVTCEGRVEDAWLDVNGHMNVTHFDRILDEAELVLFRAFGIDELYTRRTALGVFRLEKSVRYLREMLPGMAFVIESRVHWSDERRIRHFHVILDPEQRHVVATNEAQSIHVDLGIRRSVVIRDPVVLGPLRQILAASADFSLPERTGLATG